MYMYIKVDNLEIDWRRAKNGDLFFFFLQMSLFFPQEVLIFFQKSRVVWNNRIGIIFCSDRTKTNLPKVVNANTARIHENLILLGNLQKKKWFKKKKTSMIFIRIYLNFCITWKIETLKLFIEIFLSIFVHFL